MKRGRTWQRRRLWTWSIWLEGWYFISPRTIFVFLFARSCSHSLPRLYQVRRHVSLAASPFVRAPWWNRISPSDVAHVWSRSHPCLYCFLLRAFVVTHFTAFPFVRSPRWNRTRPSGVAHAWTRSHSCLYRVFARAFFVTRFTAFPFVRPPRWNRIRPSDVVRTWTGSHSCLYRVLVCPFVATRLAAFTFVRIRPSDAAHPVSSSANVQNPPERLATGWRRAPLSTSPCQLWATASKVGQALATERDLIGCCSLSFGNPVWNSIGSEAKTGDGERRGVKNWKSERDKLCICRYMPFSPSSRSRLIPGQRPVIKISLSCAAIFKAVTLKWTSNAAILFCLVTLHISCYCVMRLSTVPNRRLLPAIFQGG